jgi:aspartyl-tRNA(Asn)/glutamyl-tRNA(Gln) amidotransferase subunit C
LRARGCYNPAEPLENRRETRMSLTKKELEHVALLSRLELSDEAAMKLAGQLGKVLDYVAKLSELKTDDVAPMTHPHDVSNVFREDEVAPSLSAEEALRNAPDRAGGCFRVPRVIA